MPGAIRVAKRSLLRHWEHVQVSSLRLTNACYVCPRIGSILGIVGLILEVFIVLLGVLICLFTRFGIRLRRAWLLVMLGVVLSGTVD